MGGDIPRPAIACHRQGRVMETTTPRPTPRPPATNTWNADARRPHAPEFAHILKARHGGRAAVMVGRASRDTVTARIVWEGPDNESRMATFDAFADLVAEARTLPVPLVVVVPTSLSQSLASVGFADPHITVGVRIGPAYLTETRQLADQWKSHQVDLVRERTLTVATDASVGLGTGSAGVACVAEDGRTSAHRLQHRHDVTRCELRAILLALETFGGSLHVLSDSLTSVTLLNADRTRALPSRYAGILARIDAAASGRTISYTWVRGHAGHPLNEAANRLAISTRRGAELALPRRVQRQVRDRISLDLLHAS